jgi:hypothetical protein
VVSHATEIIDSIMLVLVRLRASRSETPQSTDAEHVIEPFSEARGCIGLADLELAGEVGRLTQSLGGSTWLKGP